jgi:hypothetical protein
MAKPVSNTCPKCGKGNLVDLTYRERSPLDAREPVQTPETHQVETYSCGHEVVGPRLDHTAAGGPDLLVERRESGETSEPL